MSEHFKHSVPVIPALRCTWCVRVVDAALNPFLTTRGIWSKAVRERHERWEVDDPSPVKRAYEPHVSPYEVRRMVGYARESRGLIMHRHSPPGMGLRPIAP